MNSELTVEELNAVSGGESLSSVVFKGMENGFTAAGGHVSCNYMGTGNAQCTFQGAGDQNVYTPVPA
jgi:hypothetical protein